MEQNLTRNGVSELPKSPRFSPNPVRVIDVLTYPAVQLLDVTGPVQVFASANDLAAEAGRARPYLLKVVAQSVEDARSSAGVALAAAPLTRGRDTLDTLLVAGREGAESAAQNPVLVEWVRQRASRARRIASVCASLAVQVAEDKFGTLHEWVKGHLADDLSLAVLADRAGMSERNFSRHYAEATGQTPARAIERLRLEAAQNLLLESRSPVKRIAQRCGFGSEETMRRSFLRLLAVTPQDYRSRFKA
jgi:transcriptional regulator GlxA family with amidase domain